MDEDSMQRSLSAALRLRGVDVVSALDAGMLGNPDDLQLEWARDEGRAVYTFNVGDFYRLHGDCLQLGSHHAGIIIAPQQRYSVGEQLRRLLRLINTLTAEDMRNRVEFLSNWS